MSRICLLLAVLGLAVPALAQGYVCAEGGGNPGKGAWAEEVFGWMVEKGNKGAAIIIGAVPLEEPDNRIDLFLKLGAKSCTGLVIDEKNADTKEVYDQVAAASVVFIRGGAQERYVNWWKGTRTEEAIHDVFNKGGVIAGTSAGCAILGEVSYDSKNGSLKPMEALQDACHKHLTLTTDFLGLVPGVLFDTHFTERGRIARLPVMLAHVRDELHRDDVVGIGVDPRTALCVEPDGTATIRGEGSVTLVEFALGTRTQIDLGLPPAVACAFITIVPAGTTFDTKARRVTSGLMEAKTSVWKADLVNEKVNGRGTAPDAPPIVDEDKPPAGAPPKPAPPEFWHQNQGLQQVLLYSINTWAQPAPLIRDVVQKLAMSPGRVGLLLGAGNQAEVMSNHVLVIRPGEGVPPASAVILDTSVERMQLTDWRTRVETARGRAEMDAWEKHVDGVIEKHGLGKKVEELLKQPESNEDPVLAAAGVDNERLREIRDSLETDKSMDPDQRDLLRELVRRSEVVRRSWAAHKLLDEAGNEELGPLLPGPSRAIVESVTEDDVAQLLASAAMGTRPAIYRAKLHILPPGWSFDLDSGAVTRPSAAKTAPKPPGL
jgi:cyanophycinase